MYNKIYSIFQYRPYYVGNLNYEKKYKKKYVMISQPNIKYIIKGTNSK